MTVQIPLQSTPNQIVQVSLNNQSCTIQVYQKFWGLFCDLYVGSNLIVSSVLCLNQTYIVRSLYLGFSGDLGFFDTQPSIVAGPSDPNYAGLASRFAFLYFAPSDLPDDYGESDWQVQNASPPAFTSAPQFNINSNFFYQIGL